MTWPVSSNPWVAPGGSGTPGPKGDQGDSGWSPVFANVADGTRRVQQVVDWVGGAGSKPATGQYVGATGLVADPASAADIRGAAGAGGTNGVNGWSPVFAVVADGSRSVQQVVDWVGGTGSKPTTGQYVGPTGLVNAASEATDIRGAAGTGTGDVVVSRPLRVEASGSLAGTECPEASEQVSSIFFMVPGTGTWEIYDDHDPNTATQMRYRRTASAGDAGGVFPMVNSAQPNALPFGNDVHVKVPASGSPIAWVNIVDKYAPVDTADGNSAVVISQANGTNQTVFVGHAYVRDIEILNPGTAGNFAVTEAVDGDTGLTELLRYPITAFGSLPTTPIKFDIYPSRFMNMGVLLPTGAVIRVNILPRY